MAKSISRVLIKKFSPLNLIADQFFDKLLEHAAIDPTRSAMFDDLHSNLAPAKQLGMTTVWLKTHKDWSNGKGDPGSEAPPHVDHATENLTDFLADLNGHRRR